MRKTIVTLVALCTIITANATILRVSNVAGSTAPFSTIEDALKAATQGDTIMLDASAESYGDFTIKVPLVVIGPGYWLQTNGVIQYAGSSSITGSIIIDEAAGGTVLCGLDIWSVDVFSPDVVIRRCYLTKGIGLGDMQHHNANRCVIQQNFIRGDIGASYNNSSFHHITNNICYNTEFRNVRDCYIAYNTFLVNGETGEVGYWACSNLTFEKNLWAGYADDDSGTNSYKDNLERESAVNVHDYDGSDADVKDAVYSTEYGAFAGDSPYVLSGVPAAPVIEDLVTPMTVEAGSKMKVTIKVGIQK